MTDKEIQAGQDLAALLGKVVETVLETMFFASPWGPAGEDSDAGQPRVAAKLAFRGSPSGELALSITTAAIRPLAAGFLGEDEVTEQQVGEMACELANMLCGSVVSYLETKMSFALGSPRLVTPEAALAGEADARRSFEMEHGTLTVVLRLGGGG